MVKRKRVLIVSAVLIAAALCGGAYLFSRLHGDERKDTVEPDQNVEVFDTPSAQDAKQNPALPFKLLGADPTAPILEVQDSTRESSWKVAWSFGGDFSQIGSFPISSNKVFGSSSKTPDVLTSYSASVITERGPKPVSDVSKDPYYEPRDGSGSEDGATWYSATLNESYQVGINNWQLSYWDSASNKTRVLDTAEELNGSSDTPELPGEIIPTMNDNDVFYASNVKRGDFWSPQVLKYDLKSGKRSIVGAGSFPWAVDGGVLYATDRIESSDDMLGYSRLVFDGGDGEKDVLTVDSAQSNWCISGVWASKKLHVVAFSNAVEPSGCYVGIWGETFSDPISWIHTLSPTVIGSISDRFFTWGSGSQLEHAEMYAFDAQNPSSVTQLGTTPGYSRPSVSSNGDALLVPVYGGADSAVSFDVVPIR